MALNLNNLSVDANGRTSFSGLSSGIDFRGAIDSIIAAKRIPIDSLETKVTENGDKITALKALRTDLGAMRDSLSKLYGAVSFQNVKDIFENKQAFASTSRVDGATAPAAANLIGVSVTNVTQTGSHTIEVLQTAAGHKVSGGAVTDITASLGLTNNDTFTLEGQTITVASSDTLLSLRDKINGINTGTTPSGVSASIISVSATENYLVLSKESGAAAMALANTTGTPLQTLGILDGLGAVATELQAPRTARFYLDGLLDQTNTIYESSFQTAAATAVGSTGQLTFSDGIPAVIGTVNYNAADSLTAIAANITANVAGVTAAVVVDGAGVRLEITGGAAFTMAETGAGTALTDLGINNKRRVIEQPTNTVSGIIQGVTLSLFQADPGTVVKFDVERDLTAVKTEIGNFVDAYNKVRALINEHRQFDTTTGLKSSDSGILFDSNALKEVGDELNRIIGAGVSGVSAEFSVFAQIGINFIDNNNLNDPLDRDTLVVTETTLDEALLNNIADVQRLFSFDFTSSDPRVSLLGFDGNTNYKAGGYTLNIANPNAASVTNNFLFSEQISNAFWGRLRLDPLNGVVDNAIPAPDGGGDADAIRGDNTLNSHGIVSTQAVTADQTYIMSTYAKKGVMDGVRLNFGGTDFFPGAYADFDLNAGTVTTTGADAESASIEDVGNGWYRVSVKADARATGTGSFEMYALNGGVAGYTGNPATDDIYLWGTQLETGTSSNTRFDDTKIQMTEGAIGANTALTTAPNGTATADALVASVNNTGHYVSPITPNFDTPVTSGVQYTLVGYAKAGTQPEARLVMGGGGPEFPAGAWVDFDLSGLGSVVNSGGGQDSASITGLGNGWYRIEMTATATTTATKGFFSQATKAAGLPGISFAGANDPANPEGYMWDLRVEPTGTPPNPSLYSETTATQLTTTANVDGLADGTDDLSATVVNGNVISVATGEAQGLRLFFSGFSFSTPGIQLNYTVGAGAQLYNKINELLDTTTGAVETELDTLTDQNDLHNERITEMLTRLEIKRSDLLDRFIRMETSLATANRILDSIKQTTDAMFAGK